METKKERRVTLRSSIKINLKDLLDSPTLGFKLKRSGASALVDSFRRAAGSKPIRSEQLRNLRSSNIVYGVKFKKIYSKFPVADRYMTGSVRELYVANR